MENLEFLKKQGSGLTSTPIISRSENPSRSIVNNPDSIREILEFFPFLLLKICFYTQETTTQLVLKKHYFFVFPPPSSFLSTNVKNVEKGDLPSRVFAFLAGSHTPLRQGLIQKPGSFRGDEKQPACVEFKQQ